MNPDDKNSKNIERFDLKDPETIDHWAKIWGVPALSIMVAIRKVGPLFRDVATEVWKESDVWNE